MTLGKTAVVVVILTSFLGLIGGLIEGDTTMALLNTVAFMGWLWWAADDWGTL